MLVIGVIGQPSSGKDVVGAHLESQGFVHISSGDQIRKAMAELGLPTDRAAINEFVTKKRAEVGASYPAGEIAEAIVGDTVISGFRNTAEVEVIKNKFGNNFVLIAVEAPLESRYQWAKERGRIGDDISFELFKQQEEKERGGSSFHEVDNVIKMADHLILNNGTKEDFTNKVDKLVGEIKVG